MNAKTGHTPRPWRVGRRSNGNYTVGVKEKGCLDIVRRVGVPRFTATSDEEEKANAYLIAAAPEMLDILRMAEGYLIADVRAEEKKGDKQTHLYGAKEMLKRIEEVIQKAEAEQ
jgi:hypothetical protein